MKVLSGLVRHDLESHACFWVEGMLRTPPAMLCMLPPHILTQLKCDPAQGYPQVLTAILKTSASPWAEMQGTLSTMLEMPRTCMFRPECYLLET